MTCTATELDLPGSAATHVYRGGSGISYTHTDVINFKDDLVFRTAVVHYNHRDVTTFLLGKVTRVEASAVNGGFWVNVTWTNSVDDFEGLPEKMDGRSSSNRVTLHVRVADFLNDTVTSRS